MFFPTLFLFSGRKIVPIPAHFLPSKTCWVGSSQLLRPISYHEVGSIAVSLISSYRKFVGNPLRGLPYGEEKCLKKAWVPPLRGGEVFKKDMGASPAGRRSVQKRHECLPCGEEKCSKKAWVPPLRGGEVLQIDIVSSPMGSQIPENRHDLLPGGESDPRK